MTHVGVGGSIGGAQPNGSRIGSECLHGTVEPSEDKPLLVVDIGVAGIELYGLLVCRERFCVALECAEHMSFVGVALYVGGIELDDTLKGSEGILEAVKECEDFAPVVVKGSLIGVELNSTLISCQGALVTVQPVESVSRIVVGIGVGGIEPDGLLKSSKSLFVTIEACKGTSLIVVKDGLLGIELCGLLIGEVCAFKATELVECIPAAIGSVGVGGIELEDLFVSGQRLFVVLKPKEHVPVLCVGRNGVRSKWPGREGGDQGFCVGLAFVGGIIHYQPEMSGVSSSAGSGGSLQSSPFSSALVIIGGRSHTLSPVKCVFIICTRVKVYSIEIIPHRIVINK